MKIAHDEKDLPGEVLDDNLFLQDSVPQLMTQMLRRSFKASAVNPDPKSIEGQVGQEEIMI